MYSKDAGTELDLNQRRANNATVVRSIQASAWHDVVDCRGTFLVLAQVRDVCGI